MKTKSSPKKTRKTKKSKPVIGFRSVKLQRTTLVGLIAVLVVLGVWFVLTILAGTNRDTAQQPFSRWSIWNMPIGDKATFGGGLPNGYNTGIVQSDTWTVATYVAKESDPTVTVNTDENGSVSLKVPSGTNSSGDADGAVAIIQPDGKTGYEFYDFKPSGGSYRAMLYSKVDLTGTGQGTGYPRASQASALGGLVRSSDWSKGEIADALAISIDRGALKNCGWVWPAISMDEGASCNSTYKGSVPFGSMIALPPSVNINGLGLSKDGLMIAKAFQNYGGYIVDSSDSGGPKVWGEYPALVGKVSNASNDMGKIGPLLRVVTNSGPNSIGGGGNPRVCYATPVGNDASKANPNGSVVEPAGCSTTGNVAPTNTVTNIIAPTTTTTAVAPPPPTTQNSKASMPPANGNLALGRPVTASSSIDNYFTPDKTTDKSLSTRWISAVSGKNGARQWLQYDLGTRYDLKSVNIVWAGDTTRKYAIQTSVDGSTFVDVAGGSGEITNPLADGVNTINSLSGTNATGRYVRIVGITMQQEAIAENWGHSVFEVGIYGNTSGNISGNTSGGSTPNTPPAVPPSQTGDTTAPTWPAGNATLWFTLNKAWFSSCATVSECAIGMSWPVASDNAGVAKYIITRTTGGQTITLPNNSVKTGNRYGLFDNNVLAGRNYTYQVIAQDAAGNNSVPIKAISSINCWWIFCSIAQ